MRCARSPRRAISASSRSSAACSRASIPTPAERAQAESVLAALPAAPLYARVDLLRLADDSLAVMEVEAIEPDLYPHLAPELPARLAEAVRARLG